MRLAWLAGILTATTLLWAQDESLTQKINRLIQDLGSDSFDTRDQATTELKKIGKPAVEALRKALQSEDPEVRLRAQQVLEEIEQGPKAKPNTPSRQKGNVRVSVRSVNGDTVYVITPAEGDAITFSRKRDGSVELRYRDETGKDQIAPADSLADFLKSHDAVARRFGISDEGIQYAGAGVRFDGGVQRKVPFRQDEKRDPFGLPDDLGKLQKDLQEQLRKLWGDRFNFGDPDEGPGDLENLQKRLQEQLRKLWGDRSPFDFRFQDDPFQDPRFEFGRNRGALHGVQWDSVPELLRSHLQIPPGSGLVVGSVQSDTLGWRFGLKKHDVLLDIDGKPVKSIQDVRSLLKPESSITILRGGKREVRKVEY